MQIDKEIKERICRNVDKIIKGKWPDIDDIEISNILSEEYTTLLSYRGFNKGKPTVSLRFLIKFSYLSETSLDDLIKKDL